MRKRIVLSVLACCLSGIGSRGDGAGPVAPAAASNRSASPEWVNRVTADIRHSEYEFSVREGGVVSSPNRAQSLRTTLSAGTLHLESRTGGTGEHAPLLPIAQCSSGRQRVLRVLAVVPAGALSQASTRPS